MVPPPPTPLKLIGVVFLPRVNLNGHLLPLLSSQRTDDLVYDPQQRCGMRYAASLVPLRI
jgi:hypothetical protein